MNAEQLAAANHQRAMNQRLRAQAANSQIEAAFGATIKGKAAPKADSLANGLDQLARDTAMKMARNPKFAREMAVELKGQRTQQSIDANAALGPAVLAASPQARKARHYVNQIDAGFPGGNSAADRQRQAVALSKAVLAATERFEQAPKTAREIKAQQDRDAKAAEAVQIEGQANALASASAAQADRVRSFLPNDGPLSAVLWDNAPTPGQVRNLQAVDAIPQAVAMMRGNAIAARALGKSGAAQVPTAVIAKVHAVEAQAHSQAAKADSKVTEQTNEAVAKLQNEAAVDKAVAEKTLAEGAEASPFEMIAKATAALAGVGLTADAIETDVGLNHSLGSLTPATGVFGS